jgi:hypothetical protein
MAFDEDAFINAGTAIAIFGVALYIYDTRKESAKSAFNSYTQPQITPYQPISDKKDPMVAGSRKNRKKNLHKKTKKN